MSIRTSQKNLCLGPPKQGCLAFACSHCRKSLKKVSEASKKGLQSWTMAGKRGSHRMAGLDGLWETSLKLGTLADGHNQSLRSCPCYIQVFLHRNEAVSVLLLLLTSMENKQSLFCIIYRLSVTLKLRYKHIMAFLQPFITEKGYAFSNFLFLVYNM